MAATGRSGNTTNVTARKVLRHPGRVPRTFHTSPFVGASVSETQTALHPIFRPTAQPAATDAAGTTVDRRAAFASLARSVEGDLLRTALYLCRRDIDWAQDLVQDALVKGYIAYREGRFMDDDNARAWLTRILTNEYIDQYRRKRKWESGIDVDTAIIQGRLDGAGLTAAPADVPGVRLLADTLDERLEQAVMSLPDDVRACVVLVDIEDVTYADAAVALRIPIGTIRSRLARGRRLLCDMLADYWENKNKGMES